MIPLLPTPLRRALAAVRPASHCEVCRAWGADRLCADCRTRHARPIARCGRCGLPVAAPVPSCGSCLRSPPPFARAVCAVDYSFSWDRLILDLKFHGLVERAPPLAQQLIAARLAADGAYDIDLVLPVPRAPTRLAERGYNQAGELARRVAREFALRSNATWLQRPIDGAHQADLPRDEWATTLRGAFMVDTQHRAHVAGRRRVALVDDVMTTGATAREAAREASGALLRAGAASVAFWAVARTP